MVPIHQIAALFGTNAKATKGKENFCSGEWTFTVSPWHLPSVADLSQFFRNLLSSDKFRLTASIDGGGGFVLTSASEMETTSFVKDLSVYHSLEDGKNTLELELSIIKGGDKSCTSLYSLKHFEFALRSLSVKQCFASFDPVCRNDEGWCILLNEITQPFSTGLLTFANEARSPAKINRKARLGLRNEVCHCQGFSNLVVPEDFHLQVRSGLEGLDNVFDRLCLITTLAYLCDVSTLCDDGRFTFKINGYRAIIGEIENHKVSAELLNDFFKIYEWAYGQGSLPDKLGLARNIISLHWKGDVKTAPDAGVYESVLSAHTIYLKQNVDRYISVKNSLSDYLAEFSQRSAKLAESIGDKLERNFIAFVGFFISTILLKAVTEKNLLGLFPKPLQIIAWGLIAVSFTHGVISVWFSIRERRRFTQDFNLLHARYGDLLDASDLKQVLGEDKGYRETLGHLDFKLKLYFAGWLATLLICSGVVIWLSRALAVTQTGSAATNIPTIVKPITKIDTNLSFITNVGQTKTSSTNLPASP
jgi:hypothetical protein